MKEETVKTLDLREVITSVISHDEYMGIMNRELNMGRLFDILKRVASHLFPDSKSVSGSTMAWNFTDMMVYDAPMGNVRLHLDHDTAVVTAVVTAWKWGWNHGA